LDTPSYDLNPNVTPFCISERSRHWVTNQRSAPTTHPANLLCETCSCMHVAFQVSQ